MSFDYVLYELSYTNFLLYSKAIPSYKPKDEGKKKTTSRGMSFGDFTSALKKIAQ